MAVVQATGRQDGGLRYRQAMWTYYKSQVASEHSAALESGADNNHTAVGYQNMVNELQTYADRISTPDVRAEADTIVAINRDMFRAMEALGGRKPAGIIRPDRRRPVRTSNSAVNSPQTLRS